MTKKLITDEHRKYLLDLRDSGITNMYGASPYLEKRYNINQEEANQILSEWMGEF